MQRITELDTPAGNFEQFGSGFTYAEPLTYEDGEGNEVNYVETNDGPFHVDGNEEVHFATEDEIQEGTNGPVNNFFWVMSDNLDQFVDRDDFVLDAEKLRGLNIALISSEDRLGLAFTGGGMDLNWQMAAAFVRLGYYPPPRLRLANLEYGIGQLGHDEAIRVAEARLYEMQRQRRILDGDIESLSSQMHQVEARVR